MEFTVLCAVPILHTNIVGKGKMEICPCPHHKNIKGISFLTMALDVGKRLNSCPGHFTHTPPPPTTPKKKKETVPIV
jgi:hypothetical protein